MQETGESSGSSPGEGDRRQNQLLRFRCVQYGLLAEWGCDRNNACRASRRNLPNVFCRSGNSGFLVGRIACAISTCPPPLRRRLPCPPWYSSTGSWDTASVGGIIWIFLRSAGTSMPLICLASGTPTAPSRAPRISVLLPPPPACWISCAHSATHRLIW